MSVINTRSFGRIWPVSWTITHDSGPFWGPEAIFMIDDPQGAFTCPSTTLTVLANSDCFVDYYSLFWGLGVISTIDKPQGALTCRSSTLAVLADSRPFRGLLLIVLGSQSDFHD